MHCVHMLIEARGQLWMFDRSQEVFVSFLSETGSFSGTWGLLSQADWPVNPKMLTGRLPRCWATSLHHYA